MDYVFPDDYSKFSDGIFNVIELHGQKISFIEVCNIDGKQVCIQRKATMNSLWSNAKGELFFKGECEELQQERIFELIFNEYEIDGVSQNIKRWFQSVTGISLHLHKKRCARMTSKVLWEGFSPLTTFTDVFSEPQNGTVIQKVVKRSVNIVKVLIDDDWEMYVESIDPNTDLTSISYIKELKFEVDSKSYSFEKWCKKFAGFSPGKYLEELEKTS